MFHKSSVHRIHVSKVSRKSPAACLKLYTNYKIKGWSRFCWTWSLYNIGRHFTQSKDNMRYKSDDLFRIRKSTTKITADSRSFLQRFLEPFNRDTNREMLPDSNLDSPLHLKLTVTPRNLTLIRGGTLKL